MRMKKNSGGLSGGSPAAREPNEGHAPRKSGGGVAEPAQGVPRRKHDPKLWAVALLLTAAIVVVVAVKSIGVGVAGPVYVNTGKVRVMDMRSEVSGTGLIEGAAVSAVPQPSHEISEILAAEGENVEEGQILATLKVDDLEEKYVKAQAALDTSKFRYEAAKVLFEEGAISKRELKEAEAAYNSDLASVESNDFREAALIRSPLTGTVVQINGGGEIHDGADGKTAPLFLIEDLSQLKMTAKFSEFDVGKIRVGQEAAISSPMLGELTATGVVSGVAPVGERKSAGSDEIVIPVHIDITDGNGVIAGVSAKASILTSLAENVLAVPNESIFKDASSGEPSCFKLERDGVIRQARLKVGIQGPLYTEVLLPGELREGDRIVLSPPPGLSDGMSVYSAPE
ncbi:MAG: efflux RND transporter periplasmic adaptor subunit [Clostridiales Family XIII bacterium]|nr:efflux RND transporter periplasmic adaptor subunit [Clostridiales Family XIII bacterium]